MWGLESGVDLIFSCEQGNAAFVRKHQRYQIRMVVANCRRSILDECQAHTHLKPVLDRRATGHGR